MTQLQPCTKRPALRYYGGAWRRAPWIVSHFPNHEVYVEPCFGAGSILLHKAPAFIETANDINSRVVNFFEVLRSSCAQLIELINLSPWHIDELDRCRQRHHEPLEDAHRFFVICWMSIHGGPTAGGASASLRWQRTGHGRGQNPPDDAINRIDLFNIAKRLKSVQFTNQDAIKLIRKFTDISESLIYFDPPYLQETRSRRSRSPGYGYTDEPTAAWHRLALRELRACKGSVIVSGYQSRLYERFLEDYGWERKEKEYVAQSASKRTECIWINPAAMGALGRVDFGLFQKKREAV